MTYKGFVHALARNDYVSREAVENAWRSLMQEKWAEWGNGMHEASRKSALDQAISQVKQCRFGNLANR